MVNPLKKKKSILIQKIRIKLKKRSFWYITLHLTIGLSFHELLFFFLSSSINFQPDENGSVYFAVSVLILISSFLHIKYLTHLVQQSAIILRITPSPLMSIQHSVRNMSIFCSLFSHFRKVFSLTIIKFQYVLLVT